MLHLYALFLPVFLAPCVAQQLSSASATADPVLQMKVPMTIKITADAVRTVGSNRDTGTLTLEAQSDGSSSEEWNMSSGKTSSAAGAVSAGRSCSRTDAAGITKDDDDLGCLRPIPWFAPWLGSALSSSGLVTLALQSVEVSGVAAHVFSLPGSTTKRSRAMGHDLQSASSVTLSYDHVTHLPTRSVYLAPSGQSGNTIEIDVVYSDYRDEGGFMLPHHLVRSVQHTQDLDVHVTTASAN